MRFISVFIVFLLTAGCQKFKSFLIDFSTYEAGIAEEVTLPKVEFTARDKQRKKIPITLVEAGRGFELITDIQFVPGEPELALVAEKNGKLQWWDLGTGKLDSLIKLPVETSSEQGLLGVALHPNFATNRKIYLNYVTEDAGSDQTVVGEFVWDKKNMRSEGAVVHKRDILKQKQPYANHNAGQLAFGPDGFLYIGFGDGGWANDPGDHGQNKSTWLGSMLRIDVDKSSKSKQYGIPKDNPFLGDKTAKPELWAYGLRNPWRYSFSKDGRLIVADVGQNKWEEVSVVEKGGNYGWGVMEADACLSEGCQPVGELPWLVYGRDDGASVTGGYVYYGKKVPELKGKYVFGDFNSGRIWAAEVRNKKDHNAARQNFKALGQWSLQISTFGQDENGEIYVADFGRGAIYRIESGRN